MSYSKTKLENFSKTVDFSKSDVNGYETAMCLALAYRLKIHHSEEPHYIMQNLDSKNMYVTVLSIGVVQELTNRIKFIKEDSYKDLEKHTRKLAASFSIESTEGCDVDYGHDMLIEICNILDYEIKTELYKLLFDNRDMVLVIRDFRIVKTKDNRFSVEMDLYYDHV